MKAIIIILVLLSLTFILTGCNNQKVDPIKHVTLTQDNLVYMEGSYLNPGTSILWCDHRRTGTNCKHTTTADSNSPLIEEPCPQADIYSLDIKAVNIDSHDNKAIKCTINDGSELIKDRTTQMDGSVIVKDYFNLGIPEDTGVGRIVIFLDYMKSHNLLVCCKIEDTQIAKVLTSVNYGSGGKSILVNPGETYGTLSNEICLPKIEVKPIC